MIIINKTGYLKYKNLKFRCSLGKNGIRKKKIEGDNVTPTGIYKLVNFFYRKDRINIIKSRISFTEIKKNMGWCDDPKSRKYNKLIKLPSKFSHEKLFRKDHLYDLIIVTSYNMDPVIKNKGSAIFIHLAKRFYRPTGGCIGLKKNNMIELIKELRTNESVKIL
jgi:L,D-peptidoglycan transpeptidase YkuD (ErfK/YbiS/YcfS/YnhG family)